VAVCCGSRLELTLLVGAPAPWPAPSTCRVHELPPERSPRLHNLLTPNHLQARLRYDGACLLRDVPTAAVVPAEQPRPQPSPPSSPQPCPQPSRQRRRPLMRTAELLSRARAHTVQRTQATHVHTCRLDRPDRSFENFNYPMNDHNVVPRPRAFLFQLFTGGGAELRCAHSV
jgi:hypothetical protein